MDSNERQAVSGSKRLVDYVVVCGLDLNNGLEPDTHQGEQSQVTPLERCYKTQPLVHFPENVEGHPIDPNSINMLCLPSGLTFCTQKKMKALESNSWFHTFIVTREDGSRSYGHALLFYEEVGDRDVCTALHTLQQMYLAELNESRAHSSGIISRSLPRSFRLLSPKLATKKVHCEPAGALYDPNKDSLYVTKAICLISSVPIVSVSKVILQSWYRMITATEQPSLPFECYLYNVLYELPMPERGKSVQLCYLYDEIIFQQPGSMELPHFDYSYRELILLLGIDNLLQLFTSVLFENQVLLCASDYYKLMLVAECVTALLFPFAWAHVYVPVLPTQLHNFLDAPVPYIMGLCTAGHSPEMLANIVPGEANLCLVDLDNCRVKVPEDLPQFPHRQELSRELVDTLTNVFKLPLPDKQSTTTTTSNTFSTLDTMVPSTVVVAPTDEPRVPSTPDREARADKKRRSSKKHSLPFLDISVDAEKLAIRERASFSGILPTPQSLSQHHSDVFHKVHAVAKKVVDTPDNLRKSRKKSTSNSEDQIPLRSPPVTAAGGGHQGQQNQHVPTNPALEELCINNAVREIFLNRFLSMFCGYEMFVVQPPLEKKKNLDSSPNLADIESWLSNNRETSLQNFDKTSFLSDQPQQHLAFLSKFIETQMFTSFVDAKILQTQAELASKRAATVPSQQLQPPLQPQQQQQSPQHQQLLHPPQQGQQQGQQQQSAAITSTTMSTGAPVVSATISGGAANVPQNNNNNNKNNNSNNNNNHNNSGGGESSGGGGGGGNHVSVHDEVSLAARDNPAARSVAIFDTRLQAFKAQLAGEELTRYVRCESYAQSAKPIELRMACPDVVLPAPKLPQESMVYSQHKPGVFQHWTLNKGYLNGTGPTEYRRRRSSADRGDREGGSEPHLSAHQQRRRSSKQRIAQENSSAALIAQSNWKFVEQLLAECKQKTKRMCVEKMGHAEAVEMGHKRASDSCKTSTIEENTLIAGLCDLLERIWSHGLQTKQGKSALWAHLQNFLEIEDGKQSGKGGMETNYLSPALAWCALHSRVDSECQTVALETEALSEETRRTSTNIESNGMPTDLSPSRIAAYDDLAKATKITCSCQLQQQQQEPRQPLPLSVPPSSESPPQQRSQQQQQEQQQQQRQQQQRQQQQQSQPQLQRQQHRPQPAQRVAQTRSSKGFDYYVEGLISRTIWALSEKIFPISDLSSATDLSSEEALVGAGVGCGGGKSAGRFATLEPQGGGGSGGGGGLGGLGVGMASSLFGSSLARDRDSREKARRFSARTTASSSAPPRRHSATPTLGDPIAPLAASLANDIRFVQAMEEVKTDIGFARAWVRLSLEKKCLSRHLKTLLSNQELLRNLYKRHAFLRSDDEKEYFVHYLLTLNALDYTSFTTSYIHTVIPYRVTIFPSRKFHANTTSANLWVTVSGTLAHTDKPLPIPKPTLEMVFKARNLGILTTLRIGHDSAGLTPKILIEHVLVRNEVTGQCIRFPSGRWLGKGIDDGATERLLIAEYIPLGMPESEVYESCRTPPRCRSPSVPRRPSEPKLSAQDIQQLVGNAVNSIVKHHYRPVNERSTLTVLLCGELGLIYSLEQLFLYGFKAIRLFRHLYLWDYFLKVKLFFESFLEENEAVLDSKNRDEHLNVMNGYINIVDKIEAAAAHTVGKDQRFQAFICVALREHFLHRMLVHVASAPITSQLYEEQSFLRDSSLLTFLVQVLENLVQVDFSDIEKSIILNVV